MFKYVKQISLVLGNTGLLLMAFQSQNLQAACSLARPGDCLPGQKPEVIDRRTYGFTIVNKCSKKVYLAKGEFNSAADQRLSGGTQLGIDYHDQYTSKGWYSVGPNQEATFFRQRSKDGNLFLHMHFAGKSDPKGIKPTNYKKSRSFCVTSKAYDSVQELSNPRRYEISNSKTNETKRGNTCAQAGGKFKTFYEMKRYTKFTISNCS